MGCASSKRIEATLVPDVYRPAPASFAVFDINSIEEPWLLNSQKQQEKEKTDYAPAPILETLDKFEVIVDTPHSWSEVSKALENLKPILHNKKLEPPSPNLEPNQIESSPIKKPPKKSVSFHTIEELDAKVSSKPTQLKKIQSAKVELKKESPKTESTRTELELSVPPGTESGGVKPLRENLFIVKDRLEREREGKLTNLDRRIGVRSRKDPLSLYPEKCPPGGVDSVVLYTTTLRGVRRTFEDCNRARSVIEAYRVGFDERDVSLHGEFLNELKDLLGEGVSVPRLFVKGRYVGGIEELVELNESGRLSELLKLVGNGKWDGWKLCEGCGNARFVPCLDCSGSCKVLKGDKKEKCLKCNENGLVQCPACH